jgi:hypothetical protein
VLFVLDHFRLLLPSLIARIPFGSPFILFTWKKSTNALPVAPSGSCAGNSSPEESLLLRRAAPGKIPEDGVEPGVVNVLHVPTSIEVAGVFLPGDKAAAQVNQSATRSPQLLASLPESCQHPMTWRMKSEPILKSCHVAK